MEVTVKKVEITLPEVDMALLKELAKKFGWNIGRKKSGIEKGLEDICRDAWRWQRACGEGV